MDGKLIRPSFGNVVEMNEYMVDRYNTKLKNKNAKVYFIGDVCFDKNVLDEIMPRLYGEKTLILGNHDRLHPKEYLKYFERIYSYRKLDKEYKISNKRVVLSHVPIHPQAELPNYVFNIHGHIHEKNIMSMFKPSTLDNNYFNVSVENIEYTPVTLSEIQERVNGYVV